MLISIALIAIITSLLLAWFSKSARIWRFCWINVVIMIIYDVVGWVYTFKLFDEGGAGLGPVLILLYITLLHIALLFVTVIAMTMFRSVKDQS